MWFEPSTGGGPDERNRPLAAWLLGAALAIAAGACGGGGGARPEAAASDARAADARDGGAPADRGDGPEDRGAAPLDGGGDAPDAPAGDGAPPSDALPAGPVPAPWMTTFIVAPPPPPPPPGDGGADGPTDATAPDAADAAPAARTYLTRHGEGRFLLEASDGMLANGFVDDSLLLVHQTVAGDAELTARLTPGAGCRRSGVVAGVTLRETRDSDSAYMMAAFSGDGLAVIQGRAYPADLVRTLRMDSGPALPLWLRVGRRGDVYSAGHSADGLRWTSQSRTLTWDADGQVELGLALAAAGSPCTVVFDQVTLIRTMPPPAPDAGDGPPPPPDGGAGGGGG